jgi:hypothetical protein
MLSYYVSVRLEFHVMMSVTISAYKRCLYEGSFLICISVYAYSAVKHILCCVFVLFVFVLCLVYPMLPVSIGCPFMEKQDIYMFSQRD